MANNCYKCEQRKVGCHSNCETYNAYKKSLDEVNKKRREESYNTLDKANRMSNFKKGNSANLVKKGFTITKV